jgi:hypothetical protein
LLRTKNISSLLLIFMGSLDCLTTVIGTLYFGTIELNPLIAGLVSTNLPAFVIIKLTVTICAGLTFILAEKTLMKSTDKEGRAFTFTHNIIRIAYAGIVLFLVIVVANNIIVLIITL